MGNKASTAASPERRGSSRYNAGASPLHEDDNRRSRRPRSSSTAAGGLVEGAAAAGAGAGQSVRGRAGSTGDIPVGTGQGGGYGGDDDDSDDEMRGLERPTDMSWYQMAKVGYQELVNAIIRPPRASYEIEALGPVEFEFVGKPFRRSDFQLRNERGHALHCSHWRPHGWRVAERAPCIVYMHGNSSARVEALPQLSLALSLGATLVAFDFSGSGLSEGEYVSLGYYEKDDVKVVIDHLRRSGTVGAIALWGRSMGAATALLHADRDMSIAALVLDSAFTDLTQLAEEMVERGRQAGLTVPSIVVKLVLRMIRGSVTKTAGFNVRDLCPIRHADRTFIPALFVAGRGDDFIRPHHSQQIHDLYAGDKNIVLVEGDHNSPRPSFLFDSVYIFLQNYLQVPADWGLDRADIPMGYPPWYLHSSAAAIAARYGGGGVDLMPSDLSDYMDWDPSAAAALGAEISDSHVGVDGVAGLGMTDARQQDFQAALFHMLAQERNSAGTRSASGNTLDGNNRSQQRRDTASTVDDDGATSPEIDIQRSQYNPDHHQQPQQQNRYARPPRTTSSQETALRSASATPKLNNGYSSDSTVGGGRCSYEGSEQQHRTSSSSSGKYTSDGPMRLETERDGVKEGTAAVAAIAAAALASGSTVSGSSGGSTGTPRGGECATPGALMRPVLAPFSVSDTSSRAASPDNFRRFGWKGISSSSHHSKTSDSEAGGGSGTAEVERSNSGGGGGGSAWKRGGSVAGVEDVMLLSFEGKDGPSPASIKYSPPLSSAVKISSNDHRSDNGPSRAASATGGGNTVALVSPERGPSLVQAHGDENTRKNSGSNGQDKTHIFPGSATVVGDAGDGAGSGGGHIFCGFGKESNEEAKRRCRIFRAGGAEGGDIDGRGEGCIFRKRGEEDEDEKHCIFRREQDHVAHDSVERGQENSGVGKRDVFPFRAGGGGGGDAGTGASDIGTAAQGGGGGGGGVSISNRGKDGVLSDGGRSKGARSDGIVVGFGSGGRDDDGEEKVRLRGAVTPPPPELPIDAPSPSDIDDGLLGVSLSAMEWSCLRIENAWHVAVCAPDLGQGFGTLKHLTVLEKC